MPLDRLVIYHTPAPLARPNPGGPAAGRGDSFIALAAFSDGSVRFGESFVAAGLAKSEWMDAEYALLARHGNVKIFLDRNRGCPLVTAPVLTCLDPTFAKPILGKVEVCPLLSWSDPSEIAERAAALAQQGNRVARVVLPAHLGLLRTVARATSRAGSQWDLRLRYRLAEPLDFTSAMIVAGCLDSASTELLEQPLPADAWRDMERLYASSLVPLSLAEPVVSAGDVFRAAGCADYIKLSLAKNGSPSRLLELVRQAQEIGLKVIIGNDTPGPIASWLEGQIQFSAGLEKPGEMSGLPASGDHFLAGFCRCTATGFLSKPELPWPAVERLLKAHCVREHSISLGAISASCA